MYITMIQVRIHNVDMGRLGDVVQIRCFQETAALFLVEHRLVLLERHLLLSLGWWLCRLRVGAGSRLLISSRPFCRCRPSCGDLPLARRRRQRRVRKGARRLHRFRPRWPTFGGLASILHIARLDLVKDVCDGYASALSPLHDIGLESALPSAVYHEARN